MDLILNTKRLTLRPAGPEDTDTTFRYTGDRDTTRHMLFLPHSDRQAAEESLQTAAAEWKKEKPSFYEFAVLLEEGAHIGGVSLFLDENRTSGELGWILCRDFWGCGYAPEAARAVLDFARKLGLEEIHAHCDTRNAPSIRVMEKLGFTRLETGVRQYPDDRGSGKEYLYCLVFE